MTATQDSRKDTKDEPVDMSILFLGIGWAVVILAILMAVFAVIDIFVEGWAEALDDASYASVVGVGGLVCITLVRSRKKVRGSATGDDKPALPGGPNWKMRAGRVLLLLGVVLSVVPVVWRVISFGTDAAGLEEATRDGMLTLGFVFVGLGFVSSMRASRPVPRGSSEGVDGSGSR